MCSFQPNRETTNEYCNLCKLELTSGFILPAWSNELGSGVARVGPRLRSLK